MESQESQKIADAVLGHLTFLYDAKTAQTAFDKLIGIIADFREETPELRQRRMNVSEKDVILITYGDQFQSPGCLPLQVFADTAHRYFNPMINSIHLLPFYPYSSDDGFSVVDYTAVNPRFGSWEDIQALRKGFRLMFDAVVNHISVRSRWFRGFLDGDPRYSDYFIALDPGTDLRSVTRPRTHPLLTPFQTSNGLKHVWTTFSSDQVDLNFKNPNVLLDVIRVLLRYVKEGAEFIRLDAIGYLWKTVGTSCIHLPETHQIVQLFRSVLDWVAPHVILITETNVPHAENISYFGDGANEAQMVYNFALPPLILHTLLTGNADVLSQWASELELPGKRTTFFNFTASHDGLGVMPAKGLLNDAEIQFLVDKTLAHDGFVNYKTNSDGSQSPYELNITLFDALSNPTGDEPASLKIDRFMASQAMMLALAGIPGIYVHSLIGSSNNLAGVAETGQNRSINREKWQQSEFEKRLANPNSIASQVFQRYRRLLKIRSKHPAFHPHGAQQIVLGNQAVFAVLRMSPSGDETILCLHNVTTDSQIFNVDSKLINTGGKFQDLLTKRLFASSKINLGPYQTCWLRTNSES